MSMDRRSFLNLAAAGVAARLLSGAPLAIGASASNFKAVVFDAFPIFDPRPVFALGERLFPGRGAELANAWRTRQFEYQWLRALSCQYADFWQATDEALLYAAELLKLDLTADKHRQLMEGYLELKAWPDVAPALQSLKGQGMRLAILSNATDTILEAGIRNAGLAGVFEHVLSTDRIKTYKPDPRAYRMAVDALGLKREEILFVAFGGWDAAGAKAFGYSTYWVNRLNLPVERLGAVPDASSQGLTGLVEFVETAR